MDAGYLTLPELAERLGVAENHVEEWIQHLDLEVPQGSDGGPRFPAEVIPLFETVRALREQVRHGVDQQRRDQWFVALHVDHDVVAIQAELDTGFGQPVAA